MLQGTLAVGILFVTIISWIPGHAASYIGEGADISGRQPKGPFPYCRLLLPQAAQCETVRLAWHVTAQFTAMQQCLHSCHVLMARHFNQVAPSQALLLPSRSHSNVAVLLAKALLVGF